MKDTRSIKLAPYYAHRGYYDKPLIPENSMAAFRRAVDHGLPAEFDVHLIADGSLVVFHDEALERETGVKGQIEDYDITNLSRLRLEGTDEKIPSFDEVLALYENTGLPLLIELKAARGNHKRLAKAVCERLDRYSGGFVIESFDPRALIEVRKLRPHFIRGQLVQDFFRHKEGLPLYQSAMLTFLVLNAATKPDFIAYRFEDRSDAAMMRMNRLIKKKGLAAAVWTITSPDDFRKAVRSGCVPIFDRICEEALQELLKNEQESVRSF